MEATSASWGTGRCSKQWFTNSKAYSSAFSDRQISNDYLQTNESGVKWHPSRINGQPLVESKGKTFLHGTLRYEWNLRG